MNIFLLILALLSAMSFGIVLVKHGQKQPRYNIWVTIINLIINWCLILLAVYNGN